MSCSPFDLRDYFLKELADSERRQVEAHAGTCPGCREELDRLRLMEAAMFSLRDEEIPQRISFVSDKVFEPSPWRRAWSAFWGSSARLGFASAAMLSVALALFAFVRPAPTIQRIVEVPRQVETVRTVSDAEIQQRVNAAVEKAVEIRTKEMVAELSQARQSLQLADASFEQWQRRDRVKYVQAANYAPADRGENQ